MLTKSNAEPGPTRSFLGSLAALLEDVCIASPSFDVVVNAFSIEEKDSEKVDAEASFEADPLMEAMLDKSASVPALTLQENLDLLVQEDAYWDGLLHEPGQASAQAVPTKATPWDAESTRTGFVLSNGSPSEAKAYCAHAREMSVVLAILQRPPAAFVSGGYPLLYHKLLQRLRLGNLPIALVGRMERLQKAFQQDLEASTLVLLDHLLSLYVDTLFYLPFHLSESEREALMDADLLSRLVDLLVCFARGRHSTALQRSFVVLLSTVVRHIARVPLETLQGLVETLLQEGAGRANFLDFVLLAAIPYYSPRESTNPSVARWLQQALQVLCQCTTYDFDLEDLFFKEGPYARQHTLLMKRILGVAVEKFWTRVSASWWSFCTMPALMSTAKSCFIYAFTWSRIPPGMLALFDVVQSQLRECAWTPSLPSQANEKESSLFSDGNKLDWRKEGTPFPTSGALVPSLCLCTNAQEIKYEQDRRGAMASPSYFINPEHRCTFFLSLYYYLAAAFLFHSDHLNETDALFFLHLTPPKTFAWSRETEAANPPFAQMNPTLKPLPLALSFPTHFIWRADRLNLFSICMDFLALKVTSVPLLTSSFEATECEFHDAAIALLYSVLSLFPQEKDRIHGMANRDLLDLLTRLLLHHLKPQDYVFTKSHVTILRMLLSLLQIHLNMVPNVPSIADKLLTERLALGFSKDPTAAINLTVLHLTAYVTLCQEAEAKMISPTRLLLFLTNLDIGVLSGSLGAMHFFTCLMVRLEEVVEAVGFRTQLLAEETTPDKIKFMIEQLFEGTATLIRAYQNGFLSLCGHATYQLIEVALTVILEIMRVCKLFAPVATSLLPSMEGCNDGNQVPFSYVLLSCLATPSNTVCLPAAQLLGMILQQGYTLFPVLSSNLTRGTRRSLSMTLHDTLKSSVGTVGNVIRLKILTLLGAHDPATLQYLITSLDSPTSNNQPVNASDLMLAKILSGIVFDESALRYEKASALELLVTIGSIESVPLGHVTSLLCEDASNNRTTSDIFEHLALTAVAIYFINAVMAMQMCNQAKSHQVVRGASSCRPSLSPGLTPLREDSGNASFLNEISKSAAVVPVKAGSPLKNVDTIDLILRQGGSLLSKAARSYEELRQQVRHIVRPATQEWQMALSAPSSESMLPVTTTLCLAIANGLRSVDPQLTMSQLRLRRKQWWHPHHISSSSSWVGASRSGAEFRAAGGDAAGRGSYPRSRRESFHTVALPNSIEMEEAAYQLVCPLVLGETYCFIGSDDDGTLNRMASILETVRRMAVVLERTLWLSAGEQEAGRVFLGRYFETLQHAIQWVSCCKPTAPLLVRPLWECTRKCLQLSNATSRLLEFFSLTSTQRLEIDASTRRALHHLLEFMQEHKKHLSLLNPCLNVVSTLGKENNIGVDFKNDVFFILADALFEETRQKDVPITHEHLIFLEGWIKIFEYLPPNACPSVVLAPLIPCLFHRASAASFSIVTDATTDIHTSYFVLALRLIGSALSRGHAIGSLSLLPLEEMMAMMDALNKFSVTFTQESPVTYRRQGWHIVWCSLLELLATAIATCTSANESAEDVSRCNTVAQRALLEFIQTRLLHFPRFLLVMGGFAEVGGGTEQASSSMPLFLWDVEELELSVRLTTQLSVLTQQMTSLLPQIQHCFLRIHRYRLHELHATSSKDPSVVQSEKDLARDVLVRAVQSQLTFFTLQPSHSLPFRINEKGDMGVVVGTSVAQKFKSTGGLFPGLLASTVDRSAPTEKPLITFDVLWRFISQEFHIVRRVQSALKSRSLDGTPSLESSVTRSPSRGHEIESSYMEDDGATSEVLTEMQARQRSVHLDNIQLSLMLYTLAVEELSQGDVKIEFSDTISTTHRRELRVCTEKLLHVLSNIVHEMKYRGSPHLLSLLDSIRERLNIALVRL